MRITTDQLNTLDDVAAKAEELALLCRRVADTLVRESRIEDRKMRDPYGSQVKDETIKPTEFKANNHMNMTYAEAQAAVTGYRGQPVINDPRATATQGAMFSRRVRKSAAFPPFEKTQG